MHLDKIHAKNLLEQHHIPLLRGAVAHSADEAVAVAHEIGLPVIVSVHPVNKVRLVRTARSPYEVHQHAVDLLRLKVNGVSATRVLVEREIHAVDHLNLLIYADAAVQRPVVVAAYQDTAAEEHINPLSGIFEFQARDLANNINLPREYWGAFTDVVQRLYACYRASDALRIELNPLALLVDGSLIAQDVKLVVDDYALFRHPEFELASSEDGSEALHRHARAAGITYIPLRGVVGCIVNGAGLGMAAMDMLMVAGLRAACVLDLGNDITSGKIAAALNILSQHSLRAIFFNLFSTKVDADMVARDLAAMLGEFNPALPIVIRLEGRNTEEARRVLEERNLPHMASATSTSQAVMRLVSLLRDGSVYVHTG